MPQRDASPVPSSRCDSHRSSIPPPSEPKSSSVAPPLAGEPGPPAPTSLDPDEITVRFDPPHLPTAIDPHTRELHLTFRHSFWKLRRVAVYAALERSNASVAVRERFAACGSSAWVLRDPSDHDRVRLATNRCRHRWCEACQRDRRRVVVANLKLVAADRELRLLTLTLAARAEPLTDQLARIYESFRLLRRRREIADRLAGGVYFLEVTFNERTERWHPHLHVLFEGRFLPHDLVKNAWLDITGDSYIVDVRRLNGPDGAASYVAKYATKAVGASVWTNPRRLDEAIAAIAAHRTFQTFGSWRDMALSKPPTDDTEWEPLCPLADLIDAARRGDADSKRLLCQLANTHDLDPLDLPFPNPDTS